MIDFGIIEWGRVIVAAVVVGWFSCFGDGSLGAVYLDMDG